MALIQQYEKSGNVLFKYRGQIPVLIFVLALPILYLTNHNLYVIMSFGYLKAFRLVWAILGILIALLGLALRAFTVSTTPKGTSGRNTQKQVADTLNTMGIYSVVRHPLYLANYLIWMGVLVFSMNLLALIMVSMAYWLYYERIMFAEEAFLRKRFGQEFEDWATEVPAIIPKFKRYKKGSMSFSFKTFLRREYATWLSTVLSFTIVDYAIYGLITTQFQRINVLTWQDWMRPSLYVLAVTLVIVLILRFLKHHTSILKKDAVRD